MSVSLRHRYQWPCDHVVTGLPRIDHQLECVSRILRRVPMQDSWLATPNVVLLCGYPRSANTFLSHYLKLALDEGTVVESHSHNPCDIYSAVRSGIPTVIPIREPLRAVSSLMIFQEDLPTIANARTRLRAYTAWYSYVARATRNADVIISGFTTSTKRPNLITENHSLARFRKQAIAMPEGAELLETITKHEGGSLEPGFAAASEDQSSQMPLPDHRRDSGLQTMSDLLLESNLSKDYESALYAFEKLEIRSM